MKPEVDNILRVFNQATPLEKAYGLNWYFQANKEARKLARTYGCKVSTAAGVIAALSPNQSWGNNLIGTERVLKAVKCGLDLQDVSLPAYAPNKQKAFAIAHGGRPTAILSGPKVTAFYKTIMYPSQSDVVTVDGHAYSIWANERHMLHNGTPTLTRAGRYEQVSEDYREVARQLGLKPWQVQATAWVVWRRLLKVWSHKQDEERRALAA